MLQMKLPVISWSASRCKRRLPLFVILGSVLLAAGCSHHEDKPSLVPIVPPVVIYPAAPTTHKSLGKVTIYKLAETKSELRAADENGLVPMTVSIPIDSKAPARDAIKHLIEADSSPIPDGTKLLGLKIDDDSGLATLNFSKEFVGNFKGGDKVEAQIINSVRATLGQFSNVQNVQVLVAGKKIAQLGGTIDLTEPLPVIRVENSTTVSNKGV